MSVMKAQLEAFLKARKVARGSVYTHTSKSTRDLEDGWPSRSYFIDHREASKFWPKYCDAVGKGVLCTLTEKQGEFAPLLVDLDFKSSKRRRQYDLDTLKGIVRIYQEEIKAIVDYSVFDPTILTCIVLEKPAPRKEDGVYKDGFHLHFPNFICRAWVQDKYLREKVTRRIVDEGVWKKAKLLTAVEDIIDTNIRSKCWMMYGSVNYKGKHSVPYAYNKWKSVPVKKRYGHVFNHKCKEILLSNVFRTEMVSRKKKLKYYLPEFLSVAGRKFDTGTPLTPEITKKQVAHGAGGDPQRKRRRRHVRRVRKESDVMADIKMIRDGEIMDMLSPERADNYYSWMDVGWTLFNIGQGMDEALDMWIEFSRRSSKFEEGVCEKEWGYMEMKNKTMGSLLYMAKKDSPEEYQQWKRTNVNSVVDNALSSEVPTALDVAWIVEKLRGEVFLCAHAKVGLWYEFDNHRWCVMDDARPIKRLITNEILDIFIEKTHKLIEECAAIESSLIGSKSTDEETITKKVELKRKQGAKTRCKKMIEKLKDPNFGKKVVEMCATLDMYDKKFLELRDENRQLLCFENGVLDLKDCVFRDGRPDDYCTFTTGIDFQAYRDDDEEMIELENHLNKVYVNPNLKNYFLDFMASCLEGGNEGKTFLIATGTSDGAKTITFSLLEMVFGTGDLGYYGKFPRQLLVQATGRTSSSGARPELARVRGKRIMGSQEVTKKESINVGFVKEATGNDSFYTRGMFESGGEISPQFTLTMACNEMPAIPGNDEALWSRVRVLPHESKFVKPRDLYKNPVPKSEAEQFKQKKFKADLSFRAILPDLAGPLAWKLFQHYRKIKLNSGAFNEPKEVLIATEAYQTENDIFKRFVGDCITRVTDEEKAKNVSLTVTSVNSEFKDWFALTYPSYKNSFGQPAVAKEVTKILGTIEKAEDLWGFGRNNRWWGYKFAEDE